jgi:hypothetical protein
MIEASAASLEMLDHAARNELTYVDALSMLHAKGRAPEGKPGVSELVVEVHLIAHATV